MSYTFNIPRLKGSKELITVLNQKAYELHQELETIDLNLIDLSEYNKRYIGDIKGNLVGYLQVYNYLIEIALTERTLEFHKYTFIDYGGGSGILSLLAKKIGFGTVVYNDIYGVSCIDAQKLSRKMDIPIDHFVKGDINDLISYCKPNKINADFIIGSDVIEHIYDIDAFLEKIPVLSDKDFTMVMGTGATPFNPRVRRKLEKEHIYSEIKDRAPQYGHKPIDSLQSFYKTRRKFIESQLPEVDDVEIDRLTKQTRGLILKDIEILLSEYKSSGILSYSPNHPTNTCDPLTGNWIEQLHDVPKLISILKTNMNRALVKSSYYMYSPNRLVQLIKTTLNCIIHFTGRFGLRISPYYIIFARKE